MFLVLFFLGLGMVSGFLFRRRTRLIRLADRLMAWMLYGLLFFLGVSLGVDRSGAGQLGSLGLQGLALAGSGIAGSILFTRLLSPQFFRASTGSAHPELVEGQEAGREA